MQRLIFIFLAAACTAVNATGIGDVAPSCPSALQDSDSTPLALSAYRGKVVYLDFWATWCPPCKKSMPFLNQLRNTWASRGLEVVAVSVDEDTDQARAFLQRYPVDYVTAFAPDGACPASYEVKAMPSAYLIDREGVVRHVHLGFRDADKDTLRARIDALLDE